ncbi:MAG: zinc ribbon domain-containing protein [Oscillospiraceae bacterium]|nr:zinc ribbon domain-containing protein [Oscillospiraceae bacterium]
MANINEVMNTAKGLADLAGKKAGEAVEVSKLKINNIKINGEIQKSYEKLGAFVYKFRKNGEENSALVDMCVKEIDELLAVLEQNEQKINETRHKAKCPDCGTLNDLQAVYCMKCGTKLQHETEDQYVEMNVASTEPETSATPGCGCAQTCGQAEKTCGEDQPENPSCGCE